VQIITVISGAAPRTITPRNGSNPFTIYEIFDHESNPWRVKDELFPLVSSWVGQTVEIVGRVEQNGQWTNRHADIVQLSAGPPMAIPQQPMPQAAQSAAAAMQQAQAAQMMSNRVPQPGAPVSAQQQLTTMAPFPTPKDQSINRQTAAKVAAALQPTNAVEFWANCVDLARYFDSGATPHAQVMTSNAPVYSQNEYPGDDNIPF